MHHAGQIQMSSLLTSFLSHGIMTIISFSSLQLASSDLAENGGRQNIGCPNSTSVAHPKLVAQSASTCGGTMFSIANNSRNSTFTPQAGTSKSNEKTETRMIPVVRTTLKVTGVPKPARNLILKSWLSSSKQNNTIVTSQGCSLSMGKQLTLFNPKSTRS